MEAEDFSCFRFNTKRTASCFVGLLLGCYPLQPANKDTHLKTKNFIFCDLFARNNLKLSGRKTISTIALATVSIPAAILIASPRRYIQYIYRQRNLLTRLLLFELASFEQKSLIYKPFQLSICGLQLNFFVCFAPATVNIPEKKFLMETLFTFTPVLQNGAKVLRGLKDLNVAKTMKNY